MSIAEKLVAIAENELKVYEAGKQSVYETIVIAQDCTNVLDAYNLFGATNSPTDKMVLFVNKAWTGFPSADTTNNQALCMLWINDEFRSATSLHATWVRWRNNEYNAVVLVNAAYDYIVSSGEEWLRVVVM